MANQPITGDTSYEENANNGQGLVAVPNETDSERVRRYAREERLWTESLRPYWTQMNKNEELYEFYKAEYTETASNIALNTPFAIIESQIAKENQASLLITAKARGVNNLAEFENWVASGIKGAIEDRRVAKIKGTFRKKKERFSRALKVVGNAAAEVAYCYVTQVVNGKKVVVADNPYIINRHYKQIIFNPARQFDSSNVYYIIDYMRFEDMKNQAYSEKKDKDGKVMKQGRFRNLNLLQKSLGKNETKLSDDTEIKYNAGDTKIAKKNEAVKVVTRWELKPAGWTRCVYANDRVLVIPDEVDPYRIKSHNLLLAMRYVVEGRPYAYGEMDPIYKPVRAQDTIVNQKIEIINKYLRGSYIATPNIDKDALMLILDQGGVMEGTPGEISSVPVNIPPPAAFQEVEELQQAIERAARYSGYSTGVAQSADDKTKGTKGGIIALQNASEPNTETQIDDLEDMFLEPYAYMVLDMKANYMADDETFDAFIDGKNPEWVKIGKGIMQGRATLKDMVTIGVITPEEMQSLIGTPGKNGEPLQKDTVVFDVSWLLDVTLSTESAQEKANQVSTEQALIDFAVEKLGAQFDPDRVVQYLADKNDASEIKSLLLTDQEKQVKAAQVHKQQQQQQAQELQSQIAIKQASKPTPDMTKTQERVNVSLNYKDLPADVQREVESLAGLAPSNLHPQVAQTLKNPLPTPPPAPMGYL